MIDEINLLQQAKRKRNEADDHELNPPLTTENLKSERATNKANDTEGEREGDPSVKLKAGESVSRWSNCCK